MHCAERAKAQSAETIKVQDSNRVRILDFITANPGTHLRKIQQELNLAMGVVQYHLYRLERDHAITSFRHGIYKRFYADTGIRVEDHGILNILSQETERDIILYLIRNPLATQKELSTFLGISPSTTSWHMRRLSEAGLTRPRRERGSVFYSINGDPNRILGLVKDYHPRIREKWSERLADLLT